MTKASDASVSVGFEDPFIVREVAGDLGAHLKLIEQELGISVKNRGNTIRISGDSAQRTLAKHLLEDLGRLAQTGRGIHPQDVRDGLRILRSDPSVDLVAFFRDVLLIGRKGRTITARTANQLKYIHALRHHDIVFGIGPAGTGKTYLAMAMAVAELKKGKCRRILLTRPAVEAGEKLGFLPGDLTEKIDPYLRPLYDALGDMLEENELNVMIEKGVIEVAPLAFMRGRTLNDAFVVLDEAQNTTVAQMKMFLTRLGERGRMVITGDVSQVDLPRGQYSGLAHALRVLSPIPQIATVRMSSEDVVRHPLVAAIIDAYEAEADRRRDARSSAD